MVVSVVYYGLQGYAGLLVPNAFAQQCTEFNTLASFRIIYYWYDVASLLAY